MALPNLTPSNFGDLQVGTLPHIEYMKVTEIASDLREFYFMDRVLNDAQVKTAGGKSFSWKIFLGGSTAAQNVGIGYQDNPQHIDTLIDATADWRNIKTDWSQFKQIVEMNNGSPEQIVDIELMQEKAAMIALVELMEANWFGASVTSSDTLTPWGMKTWITRPSSYTADGFTGGLVSGGPTSLGVSPTTYARWRNWYGQYVLVTIDDAVHRIRNMLVRTRFKAPVQGIPSLGGYNTTRVFYTNYAFLSQLEELCMHSNENLGFDFTKYDGNTMINKTAVHAIPALDADTTNPLYMLKGDDVFIYRLRNFWMRRCHYENYPGQHNAMADFVDSTYQPVFINRRNSGLIATSVTDPT